MPPHPRGTGTRQQILRAALKSFAERGYAATSVQQIVSAARVCKPVLYYYFKDKAGLYQALVDHAHDERYRLMQEAVASKTTVADKLAAILDALVEFSIRNSELMRLAFVTALSSGGAPGSSCCREKGRRNFEFIRDLLRDGQARGELKPDFTADELTMGIYGQLTSYVLGRLLVPEMPFDRDAAKRVVRLFLEGAGSRPLALPAGTSLASGGVKLTKLSRRSN